ncbi:DNA-processing protein DprA [Streptococcus gordonii]|uniref:DNA processing Smf protein n=1 Tax=Streptococcus gordonii (strain Challis / ATCC 35105 / BCRC 15272 / CH1 / DL1 / V288) TaxID=467705 RepID=A8AXH5_STRGC|nr:DNA-processing protein DprA [Streptococcus gordonii]ABV09886.1 DNA processing Smf protein [Streptococcus gordonii str. Challis substr. CH1]MBZ2137379.1 DNA-processing protein DprA [Streptococcus gordonii]QGS43551.1 DNA-protecting protein DprA [Streptococcus gordonii]VEE21578.1 DNA processing Smf protein [Streptococcus gordonii]VTS80714.1 DNA processing Smf protein [Streptococcus gordonii]
MKNYDIYKMKHAGLTNGQVLNVLRYVENKEKELSLRDIAVVSECRNPALFMERYKQIDDDFLKKSFEEFPSFSILDEIYPWDLSEIYNPPVLLFYQGNIDLLELPKVAVVGSRDSSKLGNQSVQKIIKELNNELIIVSGLARGIDTAAHMAALQNGGRTIAVIGTGLDVFYPKANKKLQSYIGKNHLVLSEYGPGEQPLKFHFPERNRIIAGLCRGVIVAEAKMRSGSLITCERAMEEGRDVFAIPGSILDGKSDGCHHLIQEGAKCIMSGSDVLFEFDF